MHSPSNDHGETREWIADSQHRRNRLDVALAAVWPDLSRARIQKLIRAGHATLNSVTAKPSDSLREGDRVTLLIPPPAPAAVRAQHLPLHILFEDEHLLVLNKAAGVVVHPGAGNQEGTLVNALLHHCKNLSGIGGVERPGIVHRLDKDTSGCLVAAKDDPTHRALAAQFASRTTKKFYLAIASGVPTWKEKIAEFPIARHPLHRKKMAVAAAGKGRHAQTAFRFLESRDRLSLILCRLHTGRTHQIRVHLKALNLPIAGDALYGGAHPSDCPRVMLHSWRLEFIHPATGKTLIQTAPVPADFHALLDAAIPTQTDLQNAAEALRH